MLTLTFDKEESFLRGHIPLQKFKNQVAAVDWGNLKEINFSGNGYCTDQVIHSLHSAKKGTLSSLHKVDLSGCQLLTDCGIKWLSEIVTGASNLKHVNLDGCCLVTDAGLARLLSVLSADCLVSVIGTSVCRLSAAREKKVRTGSGFIFPLDDGIAEFKQGGVLVVPHPSVKVSLAHSLSGQTSGTPTGLDHVSVTLKEGWGVNVNQVNLQHPLFDVIVGSKPVQVIIPFDSSADLSDVSKHVTEVVSRVILKEPDYPFMEAGQPVDLFSQKVRAGDKFMDIQSVTDHKLDVETTVLENWPITEPEDMTKGCFLSRTPLTKSHPYYLVEFVKKEETVMKFSDEGEDLPDEILIGCIRDVKLSMMTTNPYDNSSYIRTEDSKNFVVQSFPLTSAKKGDVFGFGIRGDWESEFHAGPHCRLYFTLNGNEVKYEGSHELQDGSLTRYYHPIIAINSHFLCQVKLPHLISPPKELLNIYQKEKRWFRPSFTKYCVISKAGIISCNKYTSRSEESSVVSEASIGTKDTSRTSFTIKVLTAMEDFRIGISLKGCKLYTEDKARYLFVLANGQVKMKNTDKDVTQLMKSTTNFTEGEELKFEWQVEKQPITFHGKMEFPLKVWRNGTLMCETMFGFSFYGGLPREQAVVCVKGVTSLERRVQLQQYQPHYHIQSSELDKITLGLQRSQQVYDDGTLTLCTDTKHSWPCLISKTPINPRLTYFEMEVVQCGSDTNDLGLGVTHGWMESLDSVGYSHYEVFYNSKQGNRNGEVRGHSTLKTDESLKFTAGDVVGCGVEAQFQGDGEITPDSEVQVYFTKNGQKVYTHTMKYHMDGLFPFFAQGSQSNVVRIRGFSPESRWNRVDFPSKPPSSVGGASFPGCAFTVVDVSGGGNTEALKSKVTLDKLPCVQKIKNHINTLQSESDSLEQQQRLTELVRATEKLENLAKSTNRVSYLSAKLSTKEGVVAVKSAILNHFLSHRTHQPLVYTLPPALLKVVELTREVVRGRGICPVIESQTEEGVAGPSLLEGVRNVSPKYLTGEMFLRLVEIMFHQGDLLCVQSDCGLLALDFDFACQPVDSLISFSKQEILPTNLSAVGQGSTLWSVESKEPDRDQMTLTFLQNYLGLMKIPLTLRTDVKNALVVYTLIRNLSPPKLTFSEFVSRDKSVKDCVLLQRTYSFPVLYPHQLLPLVISAVIKYGRPIILSKEGAVTLSGLVQTTVKEEPSSGSKDLVVECRCHLPQKKTVSLNDDTERSVREYTRHVFFLVTDLVDRIIKRQGILAIISQNIPLNSVNSSLGCHHNWSPLPDPEKTQSVCTLCNLCCEKGELCVHNKIQGTDLRECGCKTTTPGCVDCGICVACIKSLWKLRTELRPMAMSLTSTCDLHGVTLNPATFNEVEVDVTCGMCPPICLNSVNDSKYIMAAPGIARTFSKAVNIIDLSSAQSKNKDLRLYVKQGDRVKIRLLAPKGVMSNSTDREDPKGVVPTSVQYYSDNCREVFVLQEAGIVCYSNRRKNVGQFIGPKPFSETLKGFSLKILSSGSKCEIGIGFCTRSYGSGSMPGWRANSYGYHADDGGIYKENKAKVKEHTCSIGDVMAMDYDVKSHELNFYKNGEKVYNEKVEDNGKPMPDFYPIIGLNSQFECVKLLETDPWTPLDKNTAKFGPSMEYINTEGLIISPSKTLKMVKIHSGQCTGQIILHNTTKTPLGYKMEPASIFVVKENDESVNYSTGTIQPNEVKAIMCHALEKSSKISDVIIHWTGLQKDKKYSETEFQKKMNGKCHTYRLQAVMLHADYNQGLRRVNKGDNKKDYVLEVFKNSELIEQFWLPLDTYTFTIPFDCGNFIVRYPKSPSFNFPSELQKGMKVFVSLPNKGTAEAVITGVENSGKYQLEYTPEGNRDNEVLTGDISSLEVQGYKEGEPLLKYKADASQKYLSRTYMIAPPYLMPKGSAEVLRVRPNWITSLLTKAASCYTDIHRLTVQEQMMVRQSRNLIGWLDGYGPNGSVEDTFAFLPRSLSPTVLLYPGVGMFGDLSVHRLCFYADQLLHYQSKEKIRMRNPLHFVDMAALTPKATPSPDLTLGSKYQGWVYLALIAKQLNLPSHKLILPEKDMDSFSRQEIESLLFSLVHQFAALSSLFAAQYGGLPNQNNPTSGTKSVLQLVQGQPLIKYEGNPVTDPNNLIQHSSLCICKAHKLAMATTDSDLQGDLDLTEDLFAPYMENVNSVHLDLHQEVKFPANFFTMMPNLENFSLNGLSFQGKSFLSSDISNLKELRYINLKYVKVNDLPTSLFRGDNIQQGHIEGVTLGRVSNIMTRFSKTYRITRLTLRDVNMKELPSEIKNLVLLEELNLDHNPLTRLPTGLKELKKLQVLSIQGYPLMAFDGETENLTRQQYRDWHKKNPSITHYLTAEVVESLFDEVDNKKKGILGISEIAQLNLKLFFMCPRFGTDGFNEKFGGWPDVLFKLSSLRELYFGCQGITLVPTELKSLTKLEQLYLPHCLLLETISSKLGLMNSLNGMDLRHCPHLRTPPHEVVGRGFPSVKAYLKRLDGGYTTCRRTKLMFVGLGEAGKTSLLKALTSSSKKTSGTQNAKLTDGIDIKSWKVVAPDKGEIIYSAWDFAGQTVYYNTHQFFLTSRAVYLLLWNMRMGFEHAGLDFWLSSIACHAPDAPVIIVGTQLDQIEKPDFEEKIIRNQYPQIQGFHYVSSIDGRGIPELERQLLEVTMLQSYLEEKIPQVWLNLENKMLKLRKENAILEWKEVEQIAREEGIYHEQDLKEAISFLDNLGTVQYFDTDFLREKVVVDPQWIVNVMACVVSVRASVIQRNDGRFEHSQLDSVWEKFDPELRPWLLSLTEEFDLTYPLPGQPLNIVPCLLPLEVPEEFQWPELDPLDDSNDEKKIVYKFVYLPGGLFNRLQVRLFNFSDGKMIWKKGSYLQKNQHQALILQDSDVQLTVTVQGPRPENILFLIHETLESLISESYHGVAYDFYIPCPDCCSKQSDSFFDPYLFQASIIRKAKSMNAPFLQCTQSFHTVAMTQLLAIMPDDRNSEFDIHLQSSISALQSINNHIQFDVALLYCQADVPPKSKKDLLNPRDLKKDLEAWDYNVWMPESVTPDNTTEMTLQLKNSKLVVCCISDQFEKDDTCHDLFLYITNQLRKKVLVVVVRPSLAWQGTDLGMKIGDAFVCMIRTPERYQSKIPDLKDMLEKAMIAMEQNKLKPPDVFISYCWQNSKQAESKNTVIKNRKSLGAVDPRDIKDFLTEKKVNCWLDIERIGTYGLYLDIALGIQNCKMAVCCVSDEYADSENCMMELKYAVSLKVPLIVVPVGSGGRWESKVNILLMKMDDDPIKIPMYDTDRRTELLEKVKELFATKSRKIDEAKEKKRQEAEAKKNLEKKAQDLKFSYQEEYELLQRKFLRHIAMITSKLNFEMFPRLLVFDFVKASSTGKPKETSKPQRPSTGRERRKAVILEDEEEDWQAEEFCIKVLCEHEEGWHVSERSLGLSARSPEEVFKVIREAAPYLSRLYSVLKQSSVNLNCLRGKVGDSYCRYIDMKGFAETNFGKAYEVIHHFTVDHASKKDLMQNLHRCHLPSGKQLWLCDNHSKGNRITRMSVGSTSSRGAGLVTLTREDEFLKEHMRRNPTVLKLLKRPEPEELEEDQVEEEEEEKEEEEGKEEGNENEDEDTSKDQHEEPREPTKSRSNYVVSKKERERELEQKVDEKTKQNNGAVDDKAVKNLNARVGGPVNRAGSPAPSQGGVRQRQAGKSAAKEPQKANTDEGKAENDKQNQQASAATGGGDRKGKAAGPTSSKPTSSQRQAKAESSVCVMM